MADSRTDRLLADYEVPVLTPAAHPDGVVRGSVGPAKRPQRRADTVAVLAARGVIEALAFDPDQPRDREGKWSERAGGGTPASIRNAIDDWESQSTDTAGLDTPRLMDLGGRIGQVMSRDGTSITDAGALYDAATEALAGTDVTPRQYVTALDRQYGTSLADRVADALRTRGDTPSADVVSVDTPDSGPTVERSGPDTTVRDFPTLSIADADEAWHSIENGWTPEQEKALQVYTSLQYSNINRALWEGRGDRGPNADTIREIRSAMTGAPVSQTTYRRTSGKQFGRSEYATTDELRDLVGQTIQNPGFTSTTVDESILKDHPSVVHMEFEVPRGTPSAWVHNVGLDHDGELLLDADTRYEVISVEPMGQFETRMKVRIVP